MKLAVMYLSFIISGGVLLYIFWKRKMRRASAVFSGISMFIGVFCAYMLYLNSELAVILNNTRFALTAEYLLLASLVVYNGLSAFILLSAFVTIAESIAELCVYVRRYKATGKRIPHKKAQAIELPKVTVVRKLYMVNCSILD